MWLGISYNDRLIWSHKFFTIFEQYNSITNDNTDTVQDF